jgi:hypothetical protein
MVLRIPRIPVRPPLPVGDVSTTEGTPVVVLGRHMGRNRRASGPAGRQVHGWVIRGPVGIVHIHPGYCYMLVDSRSFEFHTLVVDYMDHLREEKIVP